MGLVHVAARSVRAAVRGPALVVSAAAASALAAPSAVAAEMEIAGGTPVGVQSLSVHATVEEGVALVDLDQTFRNPTSDVLEGVWTVRLPEAAVVHTFSMWMEGREKQGRVLEAGKARAIYDSIVRQRKDPALLEEVGWRTFRVSVFPVPAADTVRVRLRYALVVPDDLGLHELTLPLPSGGREVAAVDVAVDVRAAQGLSVLDAPGAANARIVRADGGGRVNWSAERVRPDGPFRVRFAPAGEGFTLSLLTHGETEPARAVAAAPADAADGVAATKPAATPAGPEGHFLVRIVPRLAKAPDLPRDVVFVVDRSGSMEGSKIEQARAALVRGLGTLRPGDRFGVVSFASDVSSLGGDALVPANEEWIGRARSAAASLEASGGTNIAGALDAALRLRREDAQDRFFAVVFLTDGDATVGDTDPESILRRWRTADEGRRGSPARLFALGVGGDVKDFLLSRLAAGSRGVAEYVRDDGSLEVKLSALLEQIRTPLLVDPEIEVRGVRTLSVEPRPLPDVFRGGSVVLAGRYSGDGPAELVLRGRSGTEPVELRFPVTFPVEPAPRPHVAQLWARARIDRLVEDLRRAGRMVGELRQEIVDLGVRHQVVSPYTSFLVVEDGFRIPDERELARVPLDPDARDRPTGAGAHAIGSRGHGGSYTGPSGEVPPDSREPGDPPATAEGGGPGTPGGEDAGGPSTGGGDVGAPAPSSGGGGGPTTGSGKRLSGPDDYSRPRHWWSYEAEGLLAGLRASAGPPASLPPEFVEKRLLPFLRAAASDANQGSLVRAQAIEALVRMRDADAGTTGLLASLQDGSRKDHALVVRISLLAPAWMGDRSSATRERLLAVVSDGRRSRTDRGYAAVSLGLLGEPDGGRVAQALLDAAAERPPWTAEPGRAAYFAALGLLADPSCVPGLRALLGEPALSETDRAWLVAALSRTAARAAAQAADGVAVDLLALGRSDRAGMPASRALPAAFARLHDAVSASRRADLVKRLENLVHTSPDPSVRNEAALALGRIAASLHCPDDTAKGEIRRLGTLTSADVTGDFAKIALGLAARGPRRSAALAALARESLPDRPGTRGALAVASLLAGDDSRAAAIAAWAADERGDPWDRAQALVALSVVRPAEVGALLRSELGALPAPALVGAAQGLRLVGDPAAGDLLVRVLTSRDDSQGALTAAAHALGDVAGPSVAAQLLDVALDERRYPDVQRGMAIRALGRVAARGPDPLVRLCDGFLYRAWDPTLGDLHRWATGL